MTSREGVYDLLVSYGPRRLGAQVDQTEALKAELAYFAECVTTGRSRSTTVRRA